MTITKLTALIIILAVITSFKPRYEKESENKALKILIISDLNAGYGDMTYSPDVAAVISRIAVIKPDIILCGGDMVAGQKASLTAEHIAKMWEGFNHTVLKPINNLKIPFGFTLGNHDASPNFLKDRTAAKQFWDDNIKSTRLTFTDRIHYPFYFSYIKNNVFFMSWDASAAKIKPEVLEWMKEQLKSKAAKNARLRILLGHLPLYPIVADKNKPGEVNDNADWTLNFLKENGVDLYISGHQHAYFPAHKNGMRLFNAGCIGNGPRPILGHTESAKKAYSIIEIPVKKPEEFKFDAFTPENNASIAIGNLPDSVTGFNGVIKRIDLP
ncbi:MAG TPA: metallophosphoesterase [Pedobacter sp.]|uniref:metallophosphoesterase family protein n=1 Tax=Pedobacter sp. TaxID=1411316 RepID=UPI002C8744A4|nr:metallophosphoesterase [Pedobacter sp.]HMI02179.1 metallophosphoesterase [Pedobacter sp.]